jgi:hypothetical protein
VAGACTGVCSPTSTRCNGTNVETCDATGTWKVTTGCPYVCSGAACTGVCTPGAKTLTS